MVQVPDIKYKKICPVGHGLFPVARHLERQTQTDAVAFYTYFVEAYMKGGAWGSVVVKALC